MFSAPGWRAASCSFRGGPASARTDKGAHASLPPAGRGFPCPQVTCGGGTRRAHRMGQAAAVRTEPLGQPESRRLARSAAWRAARRRCRNRAGQGPGKRLSWVAWGGPGSAGGGQGRGRVGVRGQGQGQGRAERWELKSPGELQDSGGSASAAGRPPAAVTPPAPPPTPPCHWDRPPPAGGDTQTRSRRGEGAEKEFSQRAKGPQTPDLPKVFRTGSLQLPETTSEGASACAR